jgi:hypothetical protein
VQFDKYDALTPVPRSSLPKGSMVLTTIWATKKTLNETFQGRLNTRSYKQVDRSHHMVDSITTPVTNPITLCFIFTLLCMNLSWVMVIINVEGASLQGKFENDKELYIEVPDGFKNGIQVM